MTNNVNKKSPGRPKVNNIPAAAQTSPAYYVRPDNPIDLEANSVAAREKYNFDLIEQEFKDKTEVEKLRMTYMELVRRLTVESHRFYITDIDWDNADTVRLRNAQMGNLKNMLQVVKMMQELMDRLRITDSTDADRNKELNEEAKEAMANAQKLLQMRVVK